MIQDKDPDSDDYFINLMSADTVHTLAIGGAYKKNGLVSLEIGFKVVAIKEFK
jgi:hypothetical protein